VASITVRHIYYQKTKYEVDLIDLNCQEGRRIIQEWKEKKKNLLNSLLNNIYIYVKAFAHPPQIKIFYFVEPSHAGRILACYAML
jgi:hypothetical protein